MLKTLKFLFLVYIIAAIFLYIIAYIFCDVSETGPFGDPNRVPNEIDLIMEERQVVANDKPCPDFVPGLKYGPVRVDTSAMRLVDVESKYRHVNIVGGRYSPPCVPTHRVAIIVPYRDREANLAIFLNHMHPFLVRQQIEYGIYVIEQAGSKAFNRGKLLNAGFDWVSRAARPGWPCYVLHDVDHVPQNLRLRYRCARQPRHLARSVHSRHYMLPYRGMMGGVVAVTYNQFTSVNGFSNSYWGWGGEDDDFYYRLKQAGYTVSRDKPWIGKYRMLPHNTSEPNPLRHKLLAEWSKRSQSDGLSSLQYRLHSITPYHLYTKILVDID